MTHEGAPLLAADQTSLAERDLIAPTKSLVQLHVWLGYLSLYVAAVSTLMVL